MAIKMVTVQDVHVFTLVIIVNVIIVDSFNTEGKSDVRIKRNIECIAFQKSSANDGILSADSCYIIIFRLNSTLRVMSVADPTRHWVARHPKEFSIIFLFHYSPVR